MAKYYELNVADYFIHKYDSVLGNDSFATLYGMESGISAIIVSNESNKPIWQERRNMCVESYNREHPDDIIPQSEADKIDEPTWYRYCYEGTQIWCDYAELTRLINLEVIPNKAKAMKAELGTNDIDDRMFEYLKSEQAIKDIIEARHTTETYWRFIDSDKVLIPHYINMAISDVIEFRKKDWESCYIYRQDKFPDEKPIIF